MIAKTLLIDYITAVRFIISSAAPQTVQVSPRGKQ